MPGLKVDTFGGMVPAVDDLLLPPAGAAHSENTWLYNGKLAGLRTPVLIRALTSSTAAKVFRIPNNFTDADHIDDSTWLEFDNPDTDVVRSLVVDDTYSRYYWSSTDTQPKYNTQARITAGNSGANAPFLLGIPAPSAPSVVVTGGSAANETRSYLVTWVSAYGEEGPAGTPVVATGHPDGSWDLTLPAAAAGDLGTDRNLETVRIYRTITSDAGIATFFLVAEQDITDTTYSDTASDTTVASNNELESTNWTAPPTDLQGWVTMPNGFLAGWRENEIWFSEPYRPHAWPASYTVTVDFPVVGLGVVGQTLFVGTEGNPVMITGIHPSTMAQAKSATFAPCLSRGGIVSAEEGVYYPSPEGLCLAAGGQVLNITSKLITKDKWQAFVSLPTLRAAKLGDAYFAFGSSRSGVFDTGSFETTAFAQEDFAGSYNGLLIDPRDARVAFNVMSSRETIAWTGVDVWSGEVFMVKNDSLYRINLADSDPTPQVYKWRTKIYEANKDHNFGAMQIRWTEPANAPTRPNPNDEPNIGLAAEFPDLPDGVKGYVRAYADGEQVWEREMLTSGETMKMPSGFKATQWQFEFETYVTITSVKVAASARALASV